MFSSLGFDAGHASVQPTGEPVAAGLSAFAFFDNLVVVKVASNKESASALRDARAGSLRHLVAAG